MTAPTTTTTTTTTTTAAVRTSPVLLDRDATLDKAVRLVRPATFAEGGNDVLGGIVVSGTGVQVSA